MNLNELSGIRGLKQIWKSLSTNKKEKEKDKVFARHSHHFLNRCFRDWMK